MQSTDGRSAAIIRRRSSGSKRPSCSTVSAPRSQGAIQALRSDFDQPVPAVHHTRSPGCTPIQRTVCSQLART